jgi:hypothetical protein
VLGLYAELNAGRVATLDQADAPPAGIVEQHLVEIDPVRPAERARPVEGLDPERMPFRVQTFDRPCALCGADGVYLDEVLLDDAGGRMLVQGRDPAGVQFGVEAEHRRQVGSLRPADDWVRLGGRIVGTFCLVILDNIAHWGMPSALVESVVVSSTRPAFSSA